MMLNTIQIYVLAGRGAPNRFLARWLSAIPVEWDYGPPSAYDIVRTRNRIVRHFLKQDVPRGKKHLLMIDANAVPVIPTNEIISTEGDLLYCGMTGREGRCGHYSDGDFGVKCFRVSADLLRRMSDPWFVAPPEVSDPVKPCECVYFRKQAEALGVAAKMAGIVGHLQECIAFPAPDSRLGWKIAWPSELPYAEIQLND